MRVTIVEAGVVGSAITADFACILTVTHMPQFKESFQQRIEVDKTSQGSRLQVVG